MLSLTCRWKHRWSLSASRLWQCGLPRQHCLLDVAKQVSDSPRGVTVGAFTAALGWASDTCHCRGEQRFILAAGGVVAGVVGILT